MTTSIPGLLLSLLGNTKVKSIPICQFFHLRKIKMVAKNMLSFGMVKPKDKQTDKVSIISYLRHLQDSLICHRDLA